MATLRWFLDRSKWMGIIFHILVVLVSMECAIPNVRGGDTAPPPVEPEVDRPFPPPFIFSLGGLDRDRVEALKKVPGVQQVVPDNGRVRVVWQLWKAEREQLPLRDIERLHEFLAIKKRLGKTTYTHGGAYDGRAGTIFMKTGGEVKFCMMFDDKATGHNEAMEIYLYCKAPPGQLEHEMLRDVPGTKVTIEKCGDGYVIIRRSGRGASVFWQVSDQMFVRIDNSFDPEMVAAYVNRLGSITPKEFEISVDKWVTNEIRWRFPQLDEAYRFQMESEKPYVWLFTAFLTEVFPECQRYGEVNKRTPIEDIWTWLHNQRNFLWANRENFKYNDATRGYVLKGPDRYDSKNPPDLPDELKDPPKPSEFKTSLEAVSSRKNESEVK